MADGRSGAAQERTEGPAIPAGPSASGPDGSWRRLTGRIARPRIEAAALRSYRLERRTELCFPVVGALMEAGFVGVIADKVYGVHPAVLALITAAPMFGLLSSVVWARLVHGRRKVPMITSLMCAFVGASAFVSILPSGPEGGWLLVGTQIAARLLLGGVVTIRSLVWTLNYPRDSRARIASRLQGITILTMTGTSVVGGLVLDRSPESFRVVYAVGAALGAVGILAFSRVRVIDEEAHVAEERKAHGPERVALAGLGRALDVLRNDPEYARYQACQFVLGTSNMMVEAPLIYLVSRELQAGYAVSIALTLALPLGLSLLTLPFWGAYIDRVHISRFRARHSWLFVLAQSFTWLGALGASLPWLVAARAIVGFARGGGSLAWQLGHNDFAQRHDVGLYMGVHVTLTGVRGAFAPFLGMLLYVGWQAHDLPLLGLRLPGFDGLGGHALGLACVLSTFASLGFWRLHHRMSRLPSPPTAV